jgi:branched-chain amino acid transport system permease protein
VGLAGQADHALSDATRSAGAVRLAGRVIAAAVLLAIPLVVPQFYTLLATEILIMGLFAVGFNLLLGYAGMVSFGHAAFYGVGAYTCGLLLKKAEAPFLVAFLAAPVVAALFALVFGFFCIRLTRIYFSMLTLAFSQIVWATAHKWYGLTGGDNGLIGIPVPALLSGPRALYLFTAAVALGAAGLLWRIVNAPFGRTLLAIRENPERAEFVGLDVRRAQLAAFVISGAVSGLAGALLGLFTRGAFPEYALWTKSAEVLLMTLLGGPHAFLGPALGAAILIVLNSVVTSFTEYWPLVLGVILLALIYVFPGGVMRFVLRRTAASPAEPGG